MAGWCPTGMKAQPSSPLVGLMTVTVSLKEFQNMCLQLVLTMEEKNSLAPQRLGRTSFVHVMYPWQQWHCKISERLVQGRPKEETGNNNIPLLNLERLNRKNQTNKAAVKTSKRKLLSYDQEQNENKGNKRVKRSKDVLRCLVSEENSDSVPWEKWIPCTSCTWWARGCWCLLCLWHVWISWRQKQQHWVMTRLRLI